MLEVVEEEEFIRTGASGPLHGRDHDRFVPLFEQIAVPEAGPTENMVPGQRCEAGSRARGGRGDRS